MEFVAIVWQWLCACLRSTLRSERTVQLQRADEVSLLGSGRSRSHSLQGKLRRLIGPGIRPWLTAAGLFAWDRTTPSLVRVRSVELQIYGLPANKPPTRHACRDRGW